MLTRGLSRRMAHSIWCREALKKSYSSDTKNVYAEAIRTVRLHNHPETTVNKADRKADSSFPDVRKRDIDNGSSMRGRHYETRTHFGPAFDVIKKREFSSQRMNSIIGTLSQLISIQMRFIQWYHTQLVTLLTMIQMHARERKSCF